ncbi:MAG: MAPEG family protein [Alkalinema sp. FL-bin-369]|nr:MAPEG family protein [Leptolyngbyaceae cyanobacterium LF-bin-369]
MTIELTCLLGLALWTLVLNHTPAIARITKAGVAWGIGNREEMPTVAPWVGRADRAQRNHLDNLPMLAIVILIAHITNQTDSATATASVVILVSRVAHGLVYIFGITALRGLCYLTSIVAMLTIVRSIVT